MRHDWRVPAYPSALLPWIESFASPWLADGIGKPQPYPTFYLVGIALVPLAFLGKPLLVAGALVGGGAGCAAFAAASLARERGCGVPARFAIAAYATLNPWFFSELVAGHIVMTLAYGFLLALVAELDRREPRRVVLVILGALAVTQIEFLPIAALALALWAWRRHCVTPLVAIAIASAPLVIGIVGEYGRIARTPLLLVWQIGQSVPLPASLIGRGYEFGYDRAFGAVVPALVAFAIIATGALRRIRGLDGVAWSSLAIGCVAALVASGLKGPIAIPYAWAVTHVHEIGLYRELYDLVAIVVAAEIVLLSRSLSGGTRFARGLAFGSIPAAIALSLPWFWQPVSSWTVPTADLPKISIHASAAERVALFPPFQPLTFHGEGSGTDPDLFPRPESALPIDEFVPTYPVDAALAMAAIRGDVAGLRALGVGYAVARPWYESDWGSLQYQAVLRDRPGFTSVAGTIAKPVPLVGFAEQPPTVVSTLPFGSVGEQTWDQVSTQGATSCLGRSPKPSDLTLDERRAWVSLDLAALRSPELANRYGGVVTTGSEPLLVGGRSMLAATTGDIVKAGTNATLEHATSRLRWFALPSISTSIVCRGRCAVAALSNCSVATVPKARPMIAIAPLLPHGSAIAFTLSLPSGRAGFMRFATLEDAHWVAWTPTRMLLPITLDGALQGWLLPSRRTATTVFVIEWLAVVQLGAEAVAVIVLVFVAAQPTRNRISKSQREAAASVRTMNIGI